MLLRTAATGYTLAYSTPHTPHLLFTQFYHASHTMFFVSVILFVLRIQHQWKEVVDLLLKPPPPPKKKEDDSPKAGSSTDNSSKDSKDTAKVEDKDKDSMDVVVNAPSGDKNISGDDMMGHPGERRAREYAMKGNYSAALYEMPMWCTAERAILDGLDRHGANAPLNAINQIPQSLRMMYVHAYQSFIWNHMASLRLEKWGKDKVVVGDLILLDDGSSAAAGEQNVELDSNASMLPQFPDTLRVKDEEEGRKTGDRESHSTGAHREKKEKIEKTEEEEEKEEQEKRKPLPNVHVVTAEDVAQSRYNYYYCYYYYYNCAMLH